VKLFQEGKYIQGPMRMNRGAAFEGFVSNSLHGKDILIQGMEALNRAVDGGIHDYIACYDLY
jgi:hypothetical protein